MDLRCHAISLMIIVFLKLVLCEEILVETKFIGENVELKCLSNSEGERFESWHTPFGIIAPGYNISKMKYKYDILTGTLKIHNLNCDEHGKYVCVSKDLKTGGIVISSIHLIVKEHWDMLYENDYRTNMWRSVTLALVCAMIFFFWIKLKLHYWYIPYSYDDDDAGELQLSEEIELSTDLPRSFHPNDDFVDK